MKREVKKTNKRKSKKNKNKKVLSKVVTIFIIIALVICLSFFGYKYYNIYKDFDNIVNESVKTIVVNDYSKENYDLQKTTSSSNVTITWESSNEEIISKEGVVSAPSYTSGSKYVTLKAVYRLLEEDNIAPYFLKLFGYKEKEFEYKVFVKANDATDNEIVDKVASSFVLPKMSLTSINLPTSVDLFGKVNIFWESKNPDIVTNSGEKLSNGKALLEATISCGSETRKETFEIEFTDEVTLTIAEENFDGFPKKSDYDKVLSTGDNGWTLENGITKIWEDEEAIGEEKFIVLKTAKSKNGVLTQNYDVLNPYKISFYYQLNEDLSTIADGMKVSLLMSVDSGETYNLLNDIFITDKEEHLYEEVVNVTGKARFKLVASSNKETHKVDIDDLTITRKVDVNDCLDEAVKNINPSMQNDVILPFTTKYGGTVSYHSSDESILSNNGLVTRQMESKTVTLNVSVSYDNKTSSSDVVVVIPGYDSKVAVEVYFIDLGKYGQSDCGESIYIKCGNMDILIDAGDSFESTTRSIEEVINQNSSDRILEYVIATHPDSDHIGGMKKIFEVYDVLNLIRFDGAHTTKKYDSFKTAYEAEGLNSDCKASESVDSSEDVCSSLITISEGVTLKVIDTKHYIDNLETNTRSVVTLLDAYGTKVLLTGDADNNQDKNLEAGYMNEIGDIDILKAVHHATQNGTTDEFLKAVDPETVIICNGNYFGNKHGHPTPDAINRIYKYDNSINIFAIVGGDATSDTCTASSSYECDINDPFVDRNGTILIKIDETGYHISSEYYSDSPLELSSTTFWKECSWKEETHK